MAEDDNSSLIPKLVICLIAAASAAVVVTIYHCITTGHIRSLLRIGRPMNIPSGHRAFTARLDQMQQSSVENSLADLIPSHKYKKGSGLFADQDGICSVCLSEFEDGEELRTLPECMHSFHASCIDMWLYSHSNCPMCRTNAAPSPQMLMHLLDNSNPQTPATVSVSVPVPVQQQQQGNLPV